MGQAMALAALAEQPGRCVGVAAVGVETVRAHGAIAVVATDHHLLALGDAPALASMRMFIDALRPQAHTVFISSMSSASVSSSAAPAKASPRKSLRKP